MKDLSLRYRDARPKGKPTLDRLAQLQIGEVRRILMPLLRQKRMADTKLDNKGNPLINDRGKVMKVKRRKVEYDLKCVKLEPDGQLHLISGSGSSISGQSMNTPSTLTSQSDTSMAAIYAKIKDYFECNIKFIT